MLKWETYILNFKNFLLLEKNMSNNTIEAYLRDINSLKNYINNNSKKDPRKIELHNLSSYLEDLNLTGISARSQARIISGIKAFYKYLIIEDLIENDPTELLEAPRLAQKLPTVLSIEEIDELISAIDLSKKEGHRNRAILETLYSCGLRVSELINLKI